MPALAKFGYSLTVGRKNAGFRGNNLFIGWREFIKKAEETTEPYFPPYVKDSPAVIMHTGGTTGTPKGVLFSDGSYNNLLAQLKYAGLMMERGHRFLNIMPPFIAYGLVCGIHRPLCTGSRLILIPKFEPAKFDELIMKYRPNHFWGVPTHFEHILTGKKLQNADLSFLIRAGVGGDGLNTATETKINAFLASHNCKHKVTKGYGMTELNSAACACTDYFNETGSVGIPFAGTVISAFEPGTQKELSYNERGEICVSGPAVMLEYYNNPEETDNVVQLHSDGLKWVHTGDMGYITENGLVFIVDRLKRIIIRTDGFKVYPSVIENVIMKSDAVLNCAVVGVKDEKYRQGMLPKAFVVLKSEYRKKEDAALDEIKALCKKELAEYALPAAYVLRDSLPLTPVGKIDFVALQKEAAE